MGTYYSQVFATSPNWRWALMAVNVRGKYYKALAIKYSVIPFQTKTKAYLP